MKGFPAHVPVLECSFDGDDIVPTVFFDELAKLNIRVARITNPDDCSDYAVTRQLLDYHLILIDSEICRRASASPVTRVNSVIRGFDPHDPQMSCERMVSWLADCRRQTPVFGAVLIGGKSSRMGRPKHLIKGEDGLSWLQYVMHLFEPFVSKQVVSGAGDLPGAMAVTEPIERVDDLPGVQGPLTGIGALLRSSPYTSWLICACDMPHVSHDAIQWLLEERGAGYAAVIPENPDTGKLEPLFAWYDYRCRPLVEDLIASGGRRISDLCSHSSIHRPQIPQSLIGCWRNINYPDQL